MSICARCVGATTGHAVSFILFLIGYLPPLWLAFALFAVMLADWSLQAYANIPELASYLHLPVQSGSDRILAAMKRGYTALEYKSKIRKLRLVRPNISVTSDFIIGFPL